MVRQELDLDRRPNLVQTSEFAEIIQAEAEHLVTSRNSTSLTASTATTEAGRRKEEKKETVKAAAMNAAPGGKGTGEPSGKPRCRFWGSTVGCKRGEECSYSHSWDGLQKKGRCWNCSAEGHMKPDCPFLKKEAAAPKEKVAKANVKGGSKGRPQENAGGAPQPGEDGASRGPQSGGSTKGGGAKPDKSVIETSAADELMTEVTSLMKSLRALKAIQLRYMEAAYEESRNGEERKVALVDGGATHALRRGTKEELARSSPITVELAKGSTTLFRMPGCSTLFADEEVEPIIPVRLLIDHGYQIKWDRAGL